MHRQITFALLMLALPGAGMSAAAADIQVSVTRTADQPYTVEAQFDVPVPLAAVWSVLTDYDHLSAFVSSIDRSTMIRRDGSHATVDQRGTARAWLFSSKFQVLLDVEEDAGRTIRFTDQCGRSFRVYEGEWSVMTIGSDTRVSYRLLADPVDRQPAFITARAIRGNVTRLLEDVRREILQR